MEHNTVCHECGTQNEPAYEFCKNCGAPLTPKVGETQVPPPPPQPYTTAPQAPAYASPYAAYTSSEGISAEDLSLFIGKKAPNFLPKFMAMDLSGSKVSWCWPLAVLGFLFGPIGAAFWFFYRKMFKPALILLAIGAVITLATSAMSSPIAVDTAALPEDPQDMISYFLEVATEESTVWTIAATLLNNAARIATCVLTGIFGMYLYKKHCIEKIAAYRQSGIDMRYYQMGLASAGGTSGGYLALGILAFFILTSLPSLIHQFISLL